MSGDVVGPSSSTDNAIVRFDGTTGKLIQDSGTTLDDSGNFAGPAINTPSDGLSLGQGVGTLSSTDTFLGANAGAANTTGTNNVFVGTDAGLVNTTGTGNVFVGALAGRASTTGGNNTFVGLASGYGNTTGIFNTFVGGPSGTNNTTGGSNAFLGTISGVNNTTGSHNTFVGTDSGAGNTTGSYNTHVGRSAGAGFGNNHNGCVLIGYQVGTSNTSDDRLMIDNSNTSAPLIDGDFSADTLQVNGAVTLGATSTTPVHRLNAFANTTVGSAGSGDALPATPDGYLRININGTLQKIPFYADAS